MALHIVLSMAAHRVCMGPLRQPLHSGGAVRGMYDPAGGWLQPTMWALLGVALPILTGMLPFHV